MAFIKAAGHKKLYLNQYILRNWYYYIWQVDYSHALEVLFLYRTNSDTIPLATWLLCVNKYLHNRFDTGKSIIRLQIVSLDSFQFLQRIYYSTHSVNTCTHKSIQMKLIIGGAMISHTWYMLNVRLGYVSIFIDPKDIQ